MKKLLILDKVWTCVDAHMLVGERETLNVLNDENMGVYNKRSALRKLGWVYTEGDEWCKAETDEEALELEISSYDYYYHFSDDNRVYESGRAKDERIKALANKVGQEKYKKIWNKYIELHENEWRDGVLRKDYYRE